MDGDSKEAKPHFVLVPLMAQGHTIPMFNIARLLAEHGAIVTFIITPHNASRNKAIIDSISESGLPIRFVSLRFPFAEAGLPEGCENFDELPSLDHLKHFIDACAMLREPLAAHLREQRIRPSCIISDNFHPWTGDIAREFGIPRFLFIGFGAFPSLCRYIFIHRKIFDGITDDNQLVAVPGFPTHLEITRATAPGHFAAPGTEKFRQRQVEEEKRADGAVVNTFDDLEEIYIDSYQKEMGKKVWTIGPLSRTKRDIKDTKARGRESSIAEERCSRWLDSRKPSSVLYVSFGTIVRTPPSQLFEIGLGLEASGAPFIWVIKAGKNFSDVEEWLSGGFEERVKDRGLIIRGWAPQVMILSHPAVGGFMTHCGWNSTLESISNGVPMLTWPHFADQFLNEKLVVEILNVGIAIGVKDAANILETEDDKVLIKRNRDDVKKAVCELMDEGKEGEERRSRVRELGEKAKKAMEEGGSSWRNSRDLVHQVQINMHSK